MIKRKLTNNLWLKEKIKSRLNNSSKVLDFGCGTGELIQICNDLPLKMYGCDVIIDEEHLQARFNTSHDQRSRILENSQFNIPFSDSFFDMCVSNQVFEHVSEVDCMCSELKRVLKPGGEMYLIFPVKEIIIEPHLKLLLIHRLPPDGYLVKLFLKLAFIFRLGSASKTAKSEKDWIDDRVNYLKNSLNYTKLKDFLHVLRRHSFVVSDITRTHYAERFHLSPLLNRVYPLIPFKRVAAVALLAHLPK